MVKKVTLSVPDELFDKMQKWKRSFNFSGIFQRAITQAIENKENYRERIERKISMTELIERLREEKMENDAIWLDVGREEGEGWIQNAHYDEIKIVINTPGSEIPKQELMQHNDWQVDYFNSLMRESFIHVMEGEEIYDFDYDGKEYELFERGWKEAVVDLWEEIKDKVENE